MYLNGLEPSLGEDRHRVLKSEPDCWEKSTEDLSGVQSLIGKGNTDTKGLVGVPRLAVATSILFASKKKKLSCCCEYHKTPLP